MLTMLTARVNRTVFGGVHCDGAISCPLRRLLRVCSRYGRGPRLLCAAGSVRAGSVRAGSVQAGIGIGIQGGKQTLHGHLKQLAYLDDKGRRNACGSRLKFGDVLSFRPKDEAEFVLAHAACCPQGFQASSNDHIDRYPSQNPVSFSDRRNHKSHLYVPDAGQTSRLAKSMAA
jgi:hypothetical protein